MKRKHSKYRKIWLLWVALEGLVATFAIMSSFLLLRYLYFSNGTAIPEASVSTAGSVLSAVYLPLLITLILTTGFLEHKLSANVTNLMDGLRAVAGGDYSVRLKTDKHQLLDDLCEDFNRMTEELQSVRTLREDFVNSYSHEFKTPITAIKGFAELLSEPDLTEEERQQYLRIIQDESARLAELTNRTLLLTKLQSQRFLPDQTTFSLDEQIRRCAILCAHSWEEKRLTFSAELESVDCTSNEELLRQVWINLLNNAIRYTPPGGEIGVELRQVGGEAVVRVWDTGSGMTPEVRSHIFEKYYQGAAEDKKHGLGLGLSIVHRIIELTEGRIEVDSQPQQGSSFTVYLPLNQKGALRGGPAMQNACFAFRIDRKQHSPVKLQGRTIMIENQNAYPMNLLVTLDRNYVPQLNVMLFSALQSDPAAFFDVYILHDEGLSASDLTATRALLGQRGGLHLIRVDESGLTDAPTSDRYPKAIYYRIFAAKYLPHTLDRVLYLDPDLIVRKSLRTLYELPMDAAFFAAASHIRAFLHRFNELRLGMGEDDPYINSGVMLMNLEALRAKQDTQAVFDYMERHKGRLMLPDQDIISALYGQSIIPLDPIQYNMTEKLFTLHRFNGDGMTLDDVRQRSAVIHYCGRNKPWKPGYVGELDVFYNETVSQMEKDLP